MALLIVKASAGEIVAVDWFFFLARDRRIPLAVRLGLTEIIDVARDGRIPLAVLDRLGLNGGVFMDCGSCNVALMAAGVSL